MVYCRGQVKAQGKSKHDLETKDSQLNRNSLRLSPLPSLRHAAELFNARNGKIIIELGGLNLPPEHPQFELWGGSTINWAMHTRALRILSIDINPRVTQLTREHTRRFAAVEPVTADALLFLSGCQLPIDLLYFDAWDVEQNSPYKQRHLDAFRLALPHLTPRAIVLVDDTDIDNGGKGELVVPEALANGFRILWKGRQTAFSKDEMLY